MRTGDASASSEAVMSPTTKKFLLYTVLFVLAFGSGFVLG